MRLYASIDKRLIFAAIYKFDYIWRGKKCIKSEQKSMKKSVGKS